MNNDVTTYLRCPVCREQLARDEAGLRCPRRHTFNIARGGAIDLSTGRTPHPGDDAAMVTARAEFLDRGHFDPIVDLLAATAEAYWPGAGLVVDAGTGTGHYLAGVLHRLSTATGLGLDVSRPALKRAARAHPRAAAAWTDLWGPLPLADASAGLVLDVFAPRNAAEFRRVLRPDGALLVVVPAADHLAELVTALGLLNVDPDKGDRLDQTLAGFAASTRRTCRIPMELSHAEAVALVGMGPSARHVDVPAAVATLPAPVRVTASIELTAYTLRSISSQPTGGS